MNRRILRFAGYRFRATFARRWGGGLAVVLLIGLVGGVGLGALSGARRTQSSFSTYLASTNPSDLGVAAFTPQPRDFTSVISRLPHVRGVAGFVTYDAELFGTHGAPEELLPSVSLVGSLAGEFFDQDRFTVTEGRMADPRRSGEVMVSEVAAQVLRLHVGQVLTVGFPTGASGLGHRTRLIVVGIGFLNNQVVQDNIERLPSFIIATPALTASLPAQDVGSRWYEIQVDGGTRNVPAVEDEIFRHVRAYLVFHVTSVFAQQAELAIKPDAIALWGFGAIAALAGLLLALQAISRQLKAREGDLGVLRALGADRAMTATDGLIASLGAVVVGSVLAVVVDVALSPLSPIGPARPVYPTRGVSFDWTVISLGLLALVGGLGAMTVVMAYRGAPHRTAGRSASIRSPSGVARRAATAGLPPSAAIGVHFALEPGAPRNASRVRSPLFGAVLAVTIVVATLTFGSGLSTLISHPSLYGWNWDSALDSSLGYGPIPPKAEEMLDHDPQVAAWTGVTFFTMQLDGIAAPVLFVAAPAAFSSPILSGHGLTAPGQIVLGPATLAGLHKRVGDRVLVELWDGRTIRVEIAGDRGHDDPPRDRDLRRAAHLDGHRGARAQRGVQGAERKRLPPAVQRAEHGPCAVPCRRLPRGGQSVPAADRGRRQCRVRECPQQRQLQPDRLRARCAAARSDQGLRNGRRLAGGAGGRAGGRGHRRSRLHTCGLRPAPAP